MQMLFTKSKSFSHYFEYELFTKVTDSGASVEGYSNLLVPTSTV